MKSKDPFKIMHDRIRELEAQVKAYPALLEAERVRTRSAVRSEYFFLKQAAEDFVASSLPGQIPHPHLTKFQAALTFISPR